MTSTLFNRLDEADGVWVKIDVDGETIRAREGESVAAAMLAAGVRSCRTTAISDTPRAPYCMMGVCFECLVEIDGLPNRQACQTPVKAGMQVRRQIGSAEGYR